ncbi:FAD binding domain-containing protein [Pseudomonas sp. PSE14]|uniref:FAD binding domain-containing protein n=1 Tax=Pseudomonas sp. PSE14 TaxID=3016341 RepID=UPI0023D8683B|nr:FAD binding domain-containing protein [Pseudomonas sp. PSE14]WEJ74860.1 FAD binding domain-containing protein [Pseudomonas sp. PSE14]
MSDTQATSQTPRRALVIGGSLAGLFVGNLLRRIGWSVDIFERSAHDLDSRGGGIVLQPEVVAAIRVAGIDASHLDLGVPSVHRTVLRPDGSIRSKHHSPQMQTSWSLIYTTLRNAFGDEHYHRGQALVSIEQPDAGQVIAHFADGHQERADLLIGADGGNSAVRAQFWPDAEPTYAGYVAWRGLLPENDVPAIARDVLLGDFGFANNQQSHILGYLVPGEGNDTRPGHRFYNWVWYRVVDAAVLPDVMTDADGRHRGYSVPEGQLAPAWREHLYRDADALLPPAFRATVRATPEPFVQAIRDLAVPHMVDHRVVLIGDAAAIPRPHTAASTSKAASNALALMNALARYPNDPDRALALWEGPQLALGRSLYDYGREIGDHLLFHRLPAHPAA